MNLHYLLLGIAATILVSLFLMILIYSTTNYSSLDDLTTYLEEYRKNSPNDKISNTNFALKIMPGYNTEKNVLYMEQSNDVNTEYY